MEMNGHINHPSKKIDTTKSVKKNHNVMLGRGRSIIESPASLQVYPFQSSSQALSLFPLSPIPTGLQHRQVRIPTRSDRLQRRNSHRYLRFLIEISMGGD
jgi:hypothetical protein